MITIINQPDKEIDFSEFIGRGGRFLILRELKKRIIDCQIVLGEKRDKEINLYFRIKKDNKVRWLSPQKGYLNTKTSCELALHKDLTYQVLRYNKLPIPKHKKIGKISDLKKLNLNFPVVVKPTAQAKGKDVLVGIENELRLKKSCFRLFKKYSSLIVEEFIPGKDYRLLILGGELIAAVR